MTRGEKINDDLIEEIVKKINLVPPEAVLPNVNSIIRKIFRNKEGRELIRADLDSESFAGIVEEALDVVREKVKKYPQFYKYVFDYKAYFDEFFDIYEVLNRYQKFTSYRKEIRHLAEESVYFSKTGKRRITYDSINKPESVKTHIDFTEDGKITFKVSKVVAAFEGVDPNRLRICKGCNKVYWARRKDKPACSRKCGQNLRQQKRREYVKNRFQPRASKEVTEAN